MDIDDSFIIEIPSKFELSTKEPDFNQIYKKQLEVKKTSEDIIEIKYLGRC